jgi:flavin-dependent dehydrogenase
VAQRITIIGGGLAGLALGCGLRRAGVPVRLIEAGRYPRHRVCGEFICGVSQHTLASLGIEDALAGALPLQRSQWFDHQGLVRSDTLPQQAYGLSRWLLDQRLAAQFKSSGGQLLSGQRAQRPAGAQGVVDAAGRWPARRSEGAPQWIGLKCHLSDWPDADTELEMHMGTGGYIGISRIEAGRHNICGLFALRKKLPPSNSSLLVRYARFSGLDQLAERLEGCAVVTGSEAAVSALDYGPGHCPAGVVRVGDAGGLIAPVTGNGMSMAFESALAALGPLQQYAEGTCSWMEASRQIHKAQRRQHGLRLKTARALHPFLVSKKLLPLTARLARSRLFPMRPVFALTH